LWVLDKGSNNQPGETSLHEEASYLAPGIAPSMALLALHAAIAMPTEETC
jgi:hypothetical protein